LLTFAIVIPNLNQSHFLPTAFKSLTCQKEAIELALMDGGSTDNFSEIEKRYSDNITFWRSEPDRGQADAIRTGLNKIAGDIVAWLNADDYYFPDTLEKVAKCFEENPELDVVYGDAIHVNPKGNFLSYFLQIKEFCSQKITRTNFICQPACFVRRSAYERVGGIDPALQYTMDWDLWCKLAESGSRFHYLREVLAAVRYYPGTKTLSRNWKRYMEIWRIERKYGHRLFPLSWPGSFLFDLSFQKRKNVVEKYTFAFLNIMRRLKKKLIGKNDFENNPIKRNYGFHRWDHIIEGCCTIHIPWYDRSLWTYLRLKVHPETKNYDIEINDKKCEKAVLENGFLLVKLPTLEKPHRKISIKCMNSRQWKMLEFSCMIQKAE
jgi:glycosyltransferase involved in cell wall biosynthesis